MFEDKKKDNWKLPREIYEKETNSSVLNDVFYEVLPHKWKYF